MSRQRRTFKLDEKLRIIKEAAESGITATMKKYNLSHSVLLRWRNRYKDGKFPRDDVSNLYQIELKTLAEENARLKRIIADQALELHIKNELIHKNKRLPGT